MYMTNRIRFCMFFIKISAAVHGATEKSLVLVDEFGKGTSSVLSSPFSQHLEHLFSVLNFFLSIPSISCC